MNSMTGFGVARREVEGWELRVEVQTLNGRFLSLRLRLPEGLRDLTPTVEEKLKRAFRRGSVHCHLSLGRAAGTASVAVDLERLEALCRSLQELRGRLGLAGEVTPEWLVAVPGVAQQLESAGPDRRVLEPVALEAVEEATAQAGELRQAEGRRIHERVAGNLEEMRRLVTAMNERAPQVVGACRQRLQRRVEELLAGTAVSAAGDALEREVAYLAERCDVTEELNRIDSHLQELAQSLESCGPVGRRLEFVTQELSREANTVGAKAADTEMAALVLAFRQEVERLREQAANVE